MSALPYAFHEHHGSNLFMINDDRTVILKEEDEAVFGNCILFSNQPLMLDTIFRFRVKEAVRRAGWVNLGVTTRDPEEYTVLPKWGWELPDTWIQDSHNLFYDGDHVEQVEKRVLVQPGDSVGVMVTDEGELHFIHNGADLGVTFNGLPTDTYLWAVVVPCWLRCVTLDPKTATPKVDVDPSPILREKSSTCAIS